MERVARILECWLFPGLVTSRLFFPHLCGCFTGDLGKCRVARRIFNLGSQGTYRVLSNCLAFRDRKPLRGAFSIRSTRLSVHLSINGKKCELSWHDISKVSFANLISRNSRGSGRAKKVWRYRGICPCVAFLYRSNLRKRTSMELARFLCYNDGPCGVAFRWRFLTLGKIPRSEVRRLVNY